MARRSVPNISGDPNAGPKTPRGWFNTTVVSLPTLYRFGNAPECRGWAGTGGVRPLTSEEFRLTESAKLQFRAEAYNFSIAPIALAISNLLAGVRHSARVSGMRSKRAGTFDQRRHFLVTSARSALSLQLAEAALFIPRTASVEDFRCRVGGHKSCSGPHRNSGQGNNNLSGYPRDSPRHYT